mgnify:CR=1 FL=1
MPRFFYGNFDFEHQLAGETYGTSTGAAASLTSSLACCWLGLAEAGDQIYLPANVPRGFTERLATSGFPPVGFTSEWPTAKSARSLTFVPWGWSTEVANLAEAKGFSIETGVLSAARTVNARSFSFQLETDWESALPGSCRVENLESLEQALQALRDGAERLAQGLLERTDNAQNAGEGDETDPLGRPRDSGGFSDGAGVDIPDEAERLRAREILEELRERASEQGLDQDELDYIQRLLDRFGS